jgi:hypothetical protein
MLQCGVSSVTAMTTKITTQAEGPRLEAALVYADEGSPGHWRVGAPGKDGAEEEVFSGPNACQNALEFAYRRYGSARYFAT